MLLGELGDPIYGSTLFIYWHKNFPKPWPLGVWFSLRIHVLDLWMDSDT